LLKNGAETQLGRMATGWWGAGANLGNCKFQMGQKHPNQLLELQIAPNSYPLSKLILRLFLLLILQKSSPSIQQQTQLSSPG
jgi:hypothetical protein